jgi:hypothetical protein
MNETCRTPLHPVWSIGREFPRSVRCGRDYTIVSTWPYEDPNFDVCSKLMEEKKIREEEASDAAEHAECNAQAP